MGKYFCKHEIFFNIWVVIWLFKSSVGTIRDKFAEFMMDEYID